MSKRKAEPPVEESARKRQKREEDGSAPLADADVNSLEPDKPVGAPTVEGKGSGRSNQEGDVQEKRNGVSKHVRKATTNDSGKQNASARGCDGGARQGDGEGDGEGASTSTAAHSDDETTVDRAEDDEGDGLFVSDAVAYFNIVTTERGAGKRKVKPYDFLLGAHDDDEYTLSVFEPDDEEFVE